MLGRASRLLLSATARKTRCDAARFSTLPDLQRLAPRKAVFAVSSYFKIPEQGMTDFDLLSRSSATVVWRSTEPNPHNFRVRTSASRQAMSDSESDEEGDVTPATSEDKEGTVEWDKHRLHVLASGHVVHPFRYPSLYPDDWLRFLKPEHVKCELELTDTQTCKTLQTFPLHPSVFFHDKQDIAVLRILNEADVFSACHHYQCTPLVVNDKPLLAGDDMVVHGFRVENSGTPDEVREAMSVRGLVNVDHQGQLFAATDIPSDMGMCGAPVLSTAARGSVEQLMKQDPNFDVSTMCHGMVEGLVPPLTPEERQLLEDPEAAKLLERKDQLSREDADTLKAFLLTQLKFQVEHNTVFLNGEFLTEFLTNVDRQWNELHAKEQAE